MTENSQKHNILVVDDDVRSCDSLRRRLSQAGYAATSATGGRAAIAAFEEKAFDLVLLDIMMPDVGGLEVLDRIRSIAGPADLPVLMVTGKIGADNVVEALDRGANDFIAKPVEIPVLLARVKTHLALKAAREELRGLNEDLEDKVLSRTKQLQATNAKLVEEIETRKKTEAHLLQARLNAEHAGRAKTEFLATMSHELRTPLNAVIGFSDLIVQESLGALNISQYKEYAQNVNSGGRHLLSIISDILDMSKLEAGYETLQDRVVSLKDIVELSVNLITPQATRKNISILPTVGAMDYVYADDIALKRVLTNLLSNAVKFTPDGGCVELRVETGPDGASITVQDNGVGLSPDQLETVFHPFVQAENGLDRKYEGTGLGLPIAKALADLHGGDLRLESSPGEGVRAIVTLPPERNAKAPVAD
ncbi:MAG: ATP-binding protein [Pseudomonadota bacterium]